MSEVALTRLRRTRIGFVFQGFNLLPALTARENVTLPLRLARQRVPRPWLDEVIERVGLAQRPITGPTSSPAVNSSASPSPGPDHPPGHHFRR